MTNRFLRWLLFPFSVLYGVGVVLRYAAYRLGIFRSYSFDLPVIVVGNLAVGGAGKSPLTAYLIRLFKEEYRLAVLSRGYGRKSKGFRMVEPDDLVVLSGDEPLQFKRRFPDQTIAVCEDRVEGIRKLEPNHELILLDDAYQHLALKPSFQILLFDFSSLQHFDCLLPAGNLREPMWAKNRADIIIITKSPPGLSSTEKLQLRKKIQPKAHQALFFSYLRYGDLTMFDGQKSRPLNSVTNKSKILLLTGIANPKPILRELRAYTSFVEHHDYPDHHLFTPANILKLRNAFDNMIADDTLIITTEKDAQRLRMPALKKLLANLPIFVLPVEADFEEPDKEDFEHLLKQHVREHSKNH